MLPIAWKIRRAVETVMALFLLAMVALTFADVIGRRLIGKPIYGANDITEHLMAMVVFSGLQLVTAAGAHLTIDLFDKLVGKPWMAWWRVLIPVLVTVVLAVIAWLFVKHGFNASRIFEVSQALRVPRAPLYFFMALSFMRRRYTRDLTNVDVAVMGVPFDLAVSSSPGARHGPRAVRAGSSHIAWSAPWPWEQDPYEVLSVVDYGDCQFDYGYPAGVPDEIAAAAREVLATDTALLSIGGDHFITSRF